MYVRLAACEEGSESMTFFILTVCLAGLSGCLPILQRPRIMINVIYRWWSSSAINSTLSSLQIVSYASLPWFGCFYLELFLLFTIHFVLKVLFVL